MSIDNDNTITEQNQSFAKRRKVYNNDTQTFHFQNQIQIQTPYENILTVLLNLTKKIDKLETKLNEIDAKITNKEKEIKEEFSYIS